MSVTERRADGGQMAPLARIESSERDGVRIVAVDGELDISNVALLERATFDLTNDSLGIVLDLRAASYIDSATLGVLFRLQHGLQRRGQSLRVVCGPGSSARRLLELTGFDRELACESDPEQALAALRRDVAVREG
jgi:anti-anti-sigma factor